MTMMVMAMTMVATAIVLVAMDSVTASIASLLCMIPSKLPPPPHTHRRRRLRCYYNLPQRYRVVDTAQMANAEERGKIRRRRCWRICERTHQKGEHFSVIFD
mmetsp:Transcript_26161/g.42104  ORF Transcript_26161/g.42104 Transcript_26161/m.42104 type:complete len:102 (+) Transcript_26161:624-929(+)